MPEIDSSLRERLEMHLTVCDACRLSQATEQKVAAGLREGSLRIEPVGAPPARPGSLRTRSGRLVAATGFMATTAALLLLYVLPPSPPDLGGTSRSPLSRPAFERPVEQEVLREGTVRFSWYPMEEATGYRLTVREVGGSFSWSGETKETSLHTPVDSSLPAGSRFRAILEPIPADLARPGDISVSFHTGTSGEVTAYRIGASPAPVRILGTLGLLLLALSIVQGIRASKA